MARLFDSYVFIDWSAGNGLKPHRPAKDSIWVGEFSPGRNYSRQSYHRSRQLGVQHVAGLLIEQIADGMRVLVGFDFPYGYPSGTARSLAPSSALVGWQTNWSCLAQVVEDGADNVSNRFLAAAELNRMIGGVSPGPFWGCPAAKRSATLNSTSPGFPYEGGSGPSLARLRIVEKRLPGTQEVWKLYGVGCVGSQALVGIPCLSSLRGATRLRDYSKVWPFETGFTTDPCPGSGPYVLHAEIWPGVVKLQTNNFMNTNSRMIRDRAQVRAMCEWASGLDEEGTLAGYFGPPKGLTPGLVSLCVEEEGWVLGAT